MTIESQLERMAEMQAAILLMTTGTRMPPKEKPAAVTLTNGEVKEHNTIASAVEAISKAELRPTKADPKPTPEATNAEQGGASLGDLQEKVKALAAKAGRDAVIEVFKGFKIDRMSELDAAQYVAMDLALAKAITKANEE